MKISALGGGCYIADVTPTEFALIGASVDTFKTMFDDALLAKVNAGAITFDDLTNATLFVHTISHLKLDGSFDALETNHESVLFFIAAMETVEPILKARELHNGNAHVADLVVFDAILAEFKRILEVPNE